MAVLNPPRTLPGLGRAIVNYLLDARRSLDRGRPRRRLQAGGPEPRRRGRRRSEEHDLLSARDQRARNESPTERCNWAPQVPTPKSPFDAPEFRRVLQSRVFDLGRDGDVWATQPGDGHTSGARDLNRALTWVMAQDALGQPLSWTENLQTLQPEQFGTNDRESWAIVNDTRWVAASRWIVALGLGDPVRHEGPDRRGSATSDSGRGRTANDARRTASPIHDLLARIGQALPVLHGGSMRTGLVSLLGTDPDPGIAADCADSSVGQALRISRGARPYPVRDAPRRAGHPPVPIRRRAANARHREVRRKEVSWRGTLPAACWNAT